MTVATSVVEGIVNPDGTLELTRKLNLPAGRVKVTVQTLREDSQPDRFWKMMESIWTDRRTAGRPARTREMIDAEIDALRREAEEEIEAVKRLQDECRRAREQAAGNTEPPV